MVRLKDITRTSKQSKRISNAPQVHLKPFERTSSACNSNASQTHLRHMSNAIETRLKRTSNAAQTHLKRTPNTRGNASQTHLKRIQNAPQTHLKCTLNASQTHMLGELVPQGSGGTWVVHIRRRQFCNTTSSIGQPQQISITRCQNPKAKLC